jgi:hypothetical protein
LKRGPAAVHRQAAEQLQPLVGCVDRGTEWMGMQSSGASVFGPSVRLFLLPWQLRRLPALLLRLQKAPLLKPSARSGPVDAVHSTLVATNGSAAASSVNDNLQGVCPSGAKHAHYCSRFDWTTRHDCTATFGPRYWFLWFLRVATCDNYPVAAPLGGRSPLDPTLLLAARCQKSDGGPGSLELFWELRTPSPYVRCLCRCLTSQWMHPQRLPFSVDIAVGAGLSGPDLQPPIAAPTPEQCAARRADP